MIFTLLQIKHLYFLLESVAIKGIPIPRSKHYPEIIKTSRKILETFGIPRNNKYEALLIQYIYNSEFSDHLMDDVLAYLTKMVNKELSGDVDDFIPSKGNDLQKEEVNLADYEDNSESEFDLEWKEIEEQRERKMKALQSLPRTVEPEAVRLFLAENLEFPLSDKELENILTGFQLFWKYSNPQKAGDLNFRWAVDQYLTSIESPMDRKKMEKVVDSILEYLQEIRLWGYPE